MSELQSHFLEGLRKQHELKKQEWQAQQAGKSISSTLLYKRNYRAKNGNDTNNNNTTNNGTTNNNNNSNTNNPNSKRSQTMGSINLEAIPGSKIIQNSNRQLPTSKFNAAMAVSQMPLSHKYKFSSMDGSSDPQNNTNDQNMPLMTPRTKTGQYRMCMYYLFYIYFLILYVFFFIFVCL